MQQAYRCGSMCCMHSTSFFTPWCNLIAELSVCLFHSGFILFPRFKLMFHSMPLKLNMELENEHLETPLHLLPVFPFGFHHFQRSTPCIAVLPKDLDFPPATHQVFIARVLPVTTDNLQPPIRKCSASSQKQCEIVRYTTHPWYMYIYI